MRRGAGISNQRESCRIDHVGYGTQTTQGDLLGRESAK